MGKTLPAKRLALHSLHYRHSNVSCFSLQELRCSELHFGVFCRWCKLVLHFVLSSCLQHALVRKLTSSGLFLGTLKSSGKARTICRSGLCLFLTAGPHRMRCGSFSTS